MSQLSRRGFFAAWVVGLVAGCLGRSQAKAAAPALKSTAPPLDSATTWSGLASSSDGVSSQSMTVTWTVSSPQAAASVACPGVPASDGNAASGALVSWSPSPLPR